MAEFLVHQGIDSISANADAVDEIRMTVAKTEKKLLLDAEREKDACREQMLFLSRFKKNNLINSVKGNLANKYWIDEDAEKAKSFKYFSMLHSELISRDIL